MARGINKVILIGNLGSDPEVRYTPTGVPVATLSLATSESWKDKQTGEQKELTEWHRVVFYRRQAEVCGEYLRKGSKVYIEGKLRTRKWQDQAGVDRYTTEIMGESMQMLDSKGGGHSSGGGSDFAPAQASRQYPSGGAQSNNQPPLLEPTEVASAEFDDDIPF